MISTLNLLEKLKLKPLFTLNYLSMLTKYKKSYLKVLVNRLIKKKFVFKVERGKYTAHDNCLLFASHIIHPSYLTLWSALSFYGLTTQLPLEVFVATSIRKKPVFFRRTKINFVKLPMFGFKKENYKGIEIFLTEKEKLLIDILLTSIVPLDEIEELMEGIDIKKVMEYALRTENKSLIKRAGFILDKYGFKTEELIGVIDNNYIPLLKKMKKKGIKNKKWKIIDNT